MTSGTNTFKKKVLRARRSKLETYEEILGVLVSKGPLKTTHMLHRVNINSKALKGYLEFLIKHGLVERKVVERGRIVYEITFKGVSVLNGLAAKIPPNIVEEAGNDNPERTASNFI